MAFAKPEGRKSLLTGLAESDPKGLLQKLIIYDLSGVGASEISQRPSKT